MGEIASEAGDATGDRVARVRRYWEGAWSTGDVSELGSFYADSFRQNDDELTPAELGDHLLRWRGHFPDFRADVLQVWDADGSVVSRVAYSGTHRGDFSFLPATGRAFRTFGLDVFEFDGDGRVVQHWHETDHWELFEQLGLETG